MAILIGETTIIRIYIRVDINILQFTTMAMDRVKELALGRCIIMDIILYVSSDKATICCNRWTPQPLADATVSDAHDISMEVFSARQFTDHSILFTTMYGDKGVAQ